MTRKIWMLTLLAVIATVAVLLAACDGEDRPGSVDVIDDTGSVSGPTGSVSGLEPNSGESPVGLGGYLPVSDVANHARISRDVAEINALLRESPIDWAAVNTLYVGGKNSASGDGFRTIAGFARNEGRSEAIWNDYVAYYGDQTWLDTFVTDAMKGTGAFAGEPDGVRKQGVEKGIQNQIMVAWTIHELVAARGKAADGNFDAAAGAPHNWDEGWAFYRGVDPHGAPFLTANKRGAHEHRDDDCHDHHPDLVHHTHRSDDRIQRENQVQKRDLNESTLEGHDLGGFRMMLLSCGFFVDLFHRLHDQEQSAKQQNQVAPGYAPNVFQVFGFDGDLDFRERLTVRAGRVVFHREPAFWSADVCPFEHRRGQSHDPTDTQQQNDSHDHGDPEPHTPGATALFHREPVGQDGDEDNVVDAQHDLHRGKGDECDCDFHV